MNIGFIKQRLPLNRAYSQPLQNKSLTMRLHVDLPLLLSILLLLAMGLFVLYSASNQSMALLERQVIRIALAFIGMFILAQIPPGKYRLWAPWLFLGITLLLIAVLIVGHITQGAKRWLNLGLFHFQPSEVMALSLPLMLAWYLHNKPLPPNKRVLSIASITILIPVLLIAKQPDLGTATIMASAGAGVLLLAGIRWRLVGSLFVMVIAATPLLWHFMRTYQRNRVLTFLNPERDPLGNGYHIIQSKIAIGSGGMFGKGWLQGSQSHLQFLPEHTTDFIFAVCGEELGLVGAVAVICVYLIIVGRCLYISSQAQDTFSRLLAGSITLTFFLTMFINIGMVTGILPVVGLPLPLISYGGTAVVTALAGFGILMSIHTHRRLISG